MKKLPKHYELIEIEEDENETGRVELVGKYSINPLEPIIEVAEMAKMALININCRNRDDLDSARLYILAQAIAESMKRMEEK